VTYFWNGNRSSAFDRRYEDYVEIASRPPPFDAHPAMRAPEITTLVQQRLAQQRCQFARLNFANGDMVGHTGNLLATQDAVATVDRCLGQLEASVLAQQGTLVITADHGNAEDMVERDAHGAACFDNATPRYKTSHSLNPVPFYVILPPAQQARWQLAKVQAAGLANLAATLCHLLGFKPPALYAPSLLTPR
jgi:2,3-bisphosphoglycerate-independent phosphoglycerate mutase